MKRLFRYLSALLIIAVIGVVAGVLGNHYWTHRFDPIIAKHAKAFDVDERLVWSVIYEETFFREWKIGADDEIGLMQVTPTVVRIWAKAAGSKEQQDKAISDVRGLVSDPDLNIEVGCWYLDKVRQRYKGYPAETAMALAAYNAGPSRVVDWTADTDPSKISEKDFIDHIEIQSTRSYVSSILERYKGEMASKK